MCISVRSCSRACRCGSRRIGGNQVGALRSLRLQKEHRKVGALAKRPNCRGNRSLQDYQLIGSLSGRAPELCELVQSRVFRQPVTKQSRCVQKDLTTSLENLSVVGVDFQTSFVCNVGGTARESVCGMTQEA
ncbi:hypothetical protein TNCT_576091 [Trichonephila clavata]|uniref:Uncharacterized protein n=1 Tax=Trichonephila clavata TaxID=2740835 RepID=A0A8X6H1G5_TRICU|nr:hypothetical protein TNCT_576091 [Trichonephila clavata]